MLARRSTVNAMDSADPRGIRFLEAPHRSERAGESANIFRVDRDPMPRAGQERPRSDTRLVAAVHGQVSAQLIGDLAVRLARAEADAVDEMIGDGLRQVGESLEVDRAIVWQQVGGKTNAVASHAWTGLPESAAPAQLTLDASPFIATSLAAGQSIWFMRLDDVPDPIARGAFERCGLRSAVLVPVPLTGDISGALLLGSTTVEREWPLATIEHLRLVSGILGQALVRAASVKALPSAPAHASRQSVTRAHLYPPPDFEEVGEGSVIGRSPAMARILEQLHQVARTDSTVLLRGETGTGKEILATHLHELSARRRQAMVRVNCSAIPATLIESELFGREKGAFTGAFARQLGRFELADHSTIFLDEIGDLPAEIQVKLLRVIEERQIERLGNPKGIRVDVRIVAATHRNLEERIASDAFREDLFYRLNVFPIQVPPLRERAEDIPLLVWRFIAGCTRLFGKTFEAIPRDNMAALQAYSWPGNIRELRNVVERAMIVATGPVLTIALPATRATVADGSVRLVDVERNHIRSILDSSHWRIRGSGGAAERLGLQPTTLETRMAKLGLIRPARAQATANA